MWVPRDEAVYTIVEPDNDMETQELMYLSMAVSKPVFKEHVQDDDCWDIGRNKKRNMKRAGKQRGFLVRVDPDEHSRVVPWFKAACKHLMAEEVCSKIDADEAANWKKQKKRFERGGANLGVNECRIETVARCHHVACGPGFKVELTSDMVKQHIHFFTDQQFLSVAQWHATLSQAVEQTYGRVFTAKLCGSSGVPGESVAIDDDIGDDREKVLRPNEVLIASAKKDAQLVEEEEWLTSLMGCPNDEEEEKADKTPFDSSKLPSSVQASTFAEPAHLEVTSPPEGSTSLSPTSEVVEVSSIGGETPLVDDVRALRAGKMSDEDLQTADTLDAAEAMDASCDTLSDAASKADDEEPASFKDSSADEYLRSASSISSWPRHDWQHNTASSAWPRHGWQQSTWYEKSTSSWDWGSWWTDPMSSPSAGSCHDLWHGSSEDAEAAAWPGASAASRRSSARVNITSVDRPLEIEDIDDDEYVPWAALGVKQQSSCSHQSRGGWNWQSTRSAWDGQAWKALERWPSSASGAW